VNMVPEVGISIQPVVVVVVVMTSPSDAAYMGGMGDRCPEEMRNSTRLS